MSVFGGLPEIFIGTFGQPVTVLPNNGGLPVQVTGIFVNRPVDELGIVQQGAVLHVREADAAAIRDGNFVQIGSEWFRARSVRPDGRGMASIRMEATNAPG
jgi:hypothetical protein